MMPPPKPRRPSQPTLDKSTRRKLDRLIDDIGTPPPHPRHSRPPLDDREWRRLVALGIVCALAAACIAAIGWLILGPGS